jgi:hypothetical protein
MSARATAIAVVALLVLGVALIAQAWRMKDYSLNVSIARERQGVQPASRARAASSSAAK